MNVWHKVAIAAVVLGALCIESVDAKAYNVADAQYRAASNVLYYVADRVAKPGYRTTLYNTLVSHYLSNWKEHKDATKAFGVTAMDICDVIAKTESEWCFEVMTTRYTKELAKQIATLND